MENEYFEYERSHRRKRANDEVDEKPIDFITPVIIVQIIVFSLIAVLFFAFSKTQVKTFSNIKSFYVSIMEKDLTTKEIGSKAKTVFNFFTKPRTLTNNQATQTDANNDNDYNGAGGEDLLYPNETASFSPVVLSSNIVKPVKAKKVTSKFGFRINPVTNEYGFHSGLDLSADEGTEIVAAFDGVVDTATFSKVRGNYIFLQSGNIRTVYCHCSKLLVEKGDSVKAGEVIAKVGATGQVTGPHLHFELIINDIHYNPEWVLDY